MLCHSAIIGIYNCVGGFLALPVGQLSDKVGRRPIAIFAMALDLTAYYLATVRAKRVPLSPSDSRTSGRKRLNDFDANNTPAHTGGSLPAANFRPELPDALHMESEPAQHQHALVFPLLRLWHTFLCRSGCPNFCAERARWPNGSPTDSLPAVVLALFAATLCAEVRRWRAQCGPACFAGLFDGAAISLYQVLQVRPEPALLFGCEAATWNVLQSRLACAASGGS